MTKESETDKHSQVENISDLTTIALLGNVYGKAKLEGLYMSQHSTAAKQSERSLRKDTRFYRHRINQACRNLIAHKDSEIEFISAKTRSAFDIFLRSLIDDLHTLDVSDIVQTGLQEDSDNPNEQEASTKQVEQSETSTLKADLAMFNTKTVSVTLDDYVIKKKQEFPWSKNKDAMMVPSERIDLTKPELRTKGVPNKKQANVKENVAVEYEQSNEVIEQSNKKTANNVKTKSK
jgi:hypothetical protein